MTQRRHTVKKNLQEKCTEQTFCIMDLGKTCTRCKKCAM